MKLYNTLSRKLEEFKPLGEVVKMYICGPTVYDYTHLGHVRTYVSSDILIRVLNWLDYKTKAVMNITDVGHLTDDADSGDDKVEKKAKKEKKTAKEIAEYYTDDFWKMSEMMNINKPDVVTVATEYIGKMIELIKRLEAKGVTYKTSDGIYFDTSKFTGYGQMAKLDLKGLKEGARVDKNHEKKNITDFALWKFSVKTEKRQMEWDSPWGVGFPGWHIECSAMSMSELGETLDIHTGGIDHIPVHHTNEIAQSEAATGKKFVNFWVHAGFLMVEGKKMSKSLGNFLRVKDVVDKGYEPLALRYLFLTGHYRSKMNFTYKALEAAGEGYRKLRSIVSEWKRVRTRTQLSEEKLQKLQGQNLKFKEALENDLNMPEAVAVVWQMVKSNIPEQDKWELISDWDRVLGLRLTQAEKREVKVSEEIKEMVKKRQELRKQKNWEEADKVRQEIKKKGFVVEDSGEDVKISR